MNVSKTLYRNLLWIAGKAGIRPGWAYHRYLEMTNKTPNETGTPVRPSEALLEDVRSHMNKYAYARVCKAFADSLLTNEQKRMKSEAWKVLDQNRPRFDDL